MASRTVHHGGAPRVDVRQPEEKAAQDAPGRILKIRPRELNIHVLIEPKFRARLRVGGQNGGLKKEDLLRAQDVPRDRFKVGMLDNLQKFGIIVTARLAGSEAR